MTNKSPYAQIDGRTWELTEYQNGIEISYAKGGGSVKYLLAKLGQAKSQVDVKALREAIKDHYVSTAIEDNGFYYQHDRIMSEAAQALLTLLEGDK